MNRQTSLIQLNPEDCTRTTELFLRVFTGEPWNDQWPDQATAETYIMELLGAPNSLCFGLMEHGRLVGLSLGYRFTWWEGPELFIKEFCISPELQGTGLGKGFLGLLEAELSARGVCAFWLSTERGVPAYRFYLSQGFTELEDSVFLVKGF